MQNTEDASLNVMSSIMEQRLKTIDNGETFERLQYAQAHCKTIAPEDMNHLLNPQDVQIKAEESFIDTARKIERWRNLIILLPLLFTWFSLWVASMAYSKNIEINKQAISQPFLKLWIDGFPEVSSLYLGPLQLKANIVHIFTFSDIAFLDAFLFLVLIIMTAIAQRIEFKGYMQARELRNWLQNEIFRLNQESVLWALSAGPEDKPQRWAVEVLSEVKLIITNFVSDLQDQRYAVDRLIESASRVASGADRLEGIYQDIRDNFDSTLPRLADEFTKMTENQHRTSDSLVLIATEVGVAARSIHELAQPFAAIGLADIAQNSIQKIKNTTNLQQQMLERMERLSINVEHLLIQSQKGNELPEMQVSQKGFRGFLQRLNKIFSRNKGS